MYLLIDLKTPHIQMLFCGIQRLCETLVDCADVEMSVFQVDRTVYLYGYTRGTHLKPWHKLHLAGVGDFFVGELKALPDPLVRHGVCWSVM
jgi:hypothetical protein